MQSARFVSFLLFFLTLGLVAVSTPIAEKRVASVGLDKRTNEAAILDILNTLKTATDPALASILALGQAGNVSQAAVVPYVIVLTTELDAASASLALLGAPPLSVRQSNDDIAQLVAGILTDITSAFDGLLGSAATIPGLGGLLAGVDTSLNQVLKGLETLLAGVLNLVANLLVDVAVLLRKLAFGLTLVSLGR